MKLGAIGAVLAAVAVAAAGTAFAIAHGEEAPVGAYRFSTKLTMTGIPRTNGTMYNSACSGALIAPQWIITAGHCFHSAVRSDGSYDRVTGAILADGSGAVPYHGTTATIGRHNLALNADGTPQDTSGYVVNVVYAYQSPNNDVAIARLDKPVQGIAPLALYSETPSVGMILRITGWGKTDPAQTTPYDLLQTGQVKINKSTDITDTLVMVQAYAPQADTSACAYDSGAPYFVEESGGPRLVSIENGGPTCPHSGKETTGRVDVNRQWISSVVFPTPSASTS
jgi:secreted trypsin-like serine protease